MCLATIKKKSVPGTQATFLTFLIQLCYFLCLEKSDGAHFLEKCPVAQYRSFLPWVNFGPKFFEFSIISKQK